MAEPSDLKAVIAPLRAAAYDFDEAPVRRALAAVFAADATVRLAHPLGEMPAAAVYDRVYSPLFAAWPDLERRETIVIAGTTPEGADWVGCCGYYTGVFAAPWLDIPPSGQPVAMRFHEFFRIEAGHVVEMQALWDLPEVMLQAGAWPMAPSLGREWQVPGPATQDGLADHDPGAGARSCDHVIAMLTAMKRHPAEGGPELMEMDRFWHPRMAWYGPAGIGTGRGVAGFRQAHQIPFLRAMPDRGQYVDRITYHFFGEGPYVGVTGWPNMIQTLTHDGWLGLPPTGTRLTMRSLDFWRLEGGRIRENWVLVDLLDVYAQLGVDVFERMRELTRARRHG
ncbi:MAG: ester cyclase [Pseudomonadota bacterium]